MNFRIACALFILLPFVGVPIAIYCTTRKGNKEWYKKLNKPAWAPPEILFAVAWIVVYACIGYSSCRFYDNDGGIEGWIVYGLHLVLNWVWPPIFWIMKNFKLAYIEIAILFIVAIANAVVFGAVDHVAGLLFIPDLLWLIWLVAFAHSIYVRNSTTL